MVRSGMRRSVVGLVMLAVAAGWLPQVAWGRDDGHIEGSLVDLLDQADPFMAPMSTQPSENAGARPAVEQMPAKPDPNLLNELRRVIDERHALVDRENFFTLLSDTIAAQQAFAVASSVLGRANGAVGAARMVVQKAIVLKDPGQIARARDHLARAEADARKALLNAREAQQKLDKLLGRLMPPLQTFLRHYIAMRDCVPSSRADPNLPGVAKVFDEACQQRGDFHEGHILAAICHCYLGDVPAASDHLGRAKFFEERDFWEWPQANDIVGVCFLLGCPDHVLQWVRWVEDINEKRKTPRRCYLVAVTELADGKETGANAWFARCERRWNVAVRTAARTAGRQVPDPVVLPEELAGAWAHLLLTCRKETLRKPDDVEELLAGVEPESRDWWVLRARAAVAAQRASEADTAKAEALWNDAQTHITSCQEHAPGVLKDELLAQSTAYRNNEIWIRPAPQKQAATGRSKRKPLDGVVMLEFTD